MLETFSEKSSVRNCRNLLGEIVREESEAFLGKFSVMSEKIFRENHQLKRCKILLGEIAIEIASY